MRKLGIASFHGTRFCEAFGYAGRDYLTREETKDYVFSITHNAELEEWVLEIDTYTAKHGHNPQPFDTDEWDAGKWFVRAAPVSRRAFGVLHRMARSVLAGRDVNWDESGNLLVASSRRSGIGNLVINGSRPVGGKS